jgi:hypothetical protein
MKPTTQPSLVLKALKFSLGLNSLMVASGVLSTMFTGLSGLSLISSIIALPPATLVGWVLKPKTSSLIAVAVAGMEAIAVAIAFYTLVAWLFLRYWPFWRRWWPQKDQKKSEPNP